jgi:hypothetical protein
MQVPDRQGTESQCMDAWVLITLPDLRITIMMPPGRQGVAGRFRPENRFCYR